MKPSGVRVKGSGEDGVFFSLHSPLFRSAGILTLSHIFPLKEWVSLMLS